MNLFTNLVSSINQKSSNSIKL